METTWWHEVLQYDRVSIPEEAKVLAAHPRLDEKLEQLRALLTRPERLVAFEDGVFNKIRIAYLERVYHTRDPSRLTTRAWDILLAHVASKSFRPGTAWTRTIALLNAGGDDGMRYVRQLDIESLCRVGRQIYNGPYTYARSQA
jgi:hypothetical protein